ncbi:hypothetical protein QTJ16_004283 [Diplocarpon rosae]|uniref:1-acyl-sn-glycerol-3-phosphate acyltransferase n=1 Tax=Diplocarpon rosae TaxID=946125 RepID=A0AAD9SYN0_9HELO|nr:hypothetical protein QTJ16_004283 [Diplocarpon rosae]PBP22940.1 AtaAp protein [Diplocarpon rosae]
MSSFLFYLGAFGTGYLALALFLFMLSSRFPTAGFLGFLLASYASLILSASYGVVVSVLLRLVGQGRSSQWATARFFKHVMRFTTGITFSIEDPHDYLNTTRPAVFIGPHQSELDILMLGYIFPKGCSVTAKKSLKSMPFLGWFMSLSYTVFIDRANPTNARHAMAGASEEIKREKQSVYIFPEGTRSYTKEPTLLPFKKGAFHLAVQAGVPIVPVVVANYSDVLFVPEWRFQAGNIAIKVLKPIETKDLQPADVEDLTRDTREMMLREIVALTSRARGCPMAMPSLDSGGMAQANGSGATR